METSLRSGTPRGDLQSGTGEPIVRGHGKVARAQGDYGAARRAYEESAAVYRRLGNRNRAAGALGGLGLTLLDDGDPAMRLPILLAEALREHIIGAGLLTEPELDAALRACERRVLESETLVTTFLVVQVWGRKAPA